MFVNRSVVVIGENYLSSQFTVCPWTIWLTPDSCNVNYVDLLDVLGVWLFGFLGFFWVFHFLIQMRCLEGHPPLSSWKWSTFGKGNLHVDKKFAFCCPHL